MTVLFYDIESAVDPLVAELDHRTLNDIDGLGNPTAENIALWLWRRLRPGLPALSGIV